MIAIIIIKINNVYITFLTGSYISSDAYVVGQVGTTTGAIITCQYHICRYFCLLKKMFLPSVPDRRCVWLLMQNHQSVMSRRPVAGSAKRIAMWTADVANILACLFIFFYAPIFIFIFIFFYFYFLFFL